MRSKKKRNWLFPPMTVFIRTRSFLLILPAASGAFTRRRFHSAKRTGIEPGPVGLEPCEPLSDDIFRAETFAWAESLKRFFKSSGIRIAKSFVKARDTRGGRGGEALETPFHPAQNNVL